MNRFCTLAATAALTAVLAAGLGAGDANAQQAKSVKDQLVGSWELVSLVSQTGDKKVDAFGPNPIGRMTLDADGRFSTITLRPGLPHFASGNRMKGTPDEHKAVVQGSMAFFGTYTVHEADKSIMFRLEFATFPNWNGVEQKRIFTLSGDELSYVNPMSTVGASKVLVVWKRVPPIIQDQYVCIGADCYGRY
jgi:hypothetical protein